jgi:hypothetical protein
MNAVDHRVRGVCASYTSSAASQRHKLLQIADTCASLSCTFTNNRKEQDRMLSHVHIKAAADIDDEQPVQEDVPAPSM